MMHVEEEKEMVTYLGRAVQRKGFRAVIYSSEGQQRIAESYDEFDLLTHSDGWFATREEAESAKKPVRKRYYKEEDASKEKGE